MPSFLPFYSDIRRTYEYSKITPFIPIYCTMPPDDNSFGLTYSLPLSCTLSSISSLTISRAPAATAAAVSVTSGTAVPGICHEILNSTQDFRGKHAHLLRGNTN